MQTQVTGPEIIARITSTNARHPPALPGRQPKFDNCGNRKVSSKRSRKILHQGETMRRTGRIYDAQRAMKINASIG